MIIISARKDFDNPDHISLEGHKFKDINITNDSEVKEWPSFDELKDELENKNILVLVHGYNNEQFEVYDAYQIIEQKIANIIPNVYDYVIGYSWPGGDRGLEWWQAKSRANSIARMFRFLIEELSKSVNTLDLMSHSLGQGGIILC